MGSDLTQRHQARSNASREVAEGDCEATHQRPRDTEVGDAARWPRVRLGDVCETINGLWKGTKIPLKRVGIIRSTNFTKQCEFTLEKTIYIDVEEKKYFARKLLPGDLIVERSGGGPGQPVGRCVCFDVKDGDYSISNFTSILRIRDTRQIHHRYLQRYLTAIYFQGATESIQSNATGLHNLDFEAYLDFEIPLPPLPVQREIVARLERELGAVDKLAKKFDELEAAAEAEFKAELKETFEEIKHRGKMHRRSSASEGRFGEAEPEGRASVCETQRLGDVCEIQRGGSPRPIKSFITEDLNGLNWIKIGDVSPDGKYITKTADKIKQSGLAKTRQVFAGDFLLSNSMSFGRPYILRINGCIHDGWLVLRGFKSTFSEEYFYYLLRSDFVQDQFNKLAHGSTVRNLNTEAVAMVEVCKASFSVQREVVARLDAAKAKKEKLVAAARRGRETAALMRKAILKEAFE